MSEASRKKAFLPGGKTLMVRLSDRIIGMASSTRALSSEIDSEPMISIRYVFPQNVRTRGFISYIYVFMTEGARARCLSMT